MPSSPAAALRGGLLVRRIEHGRVDGEVRIPRAAKRRPCKGEVIAVGDDKDRGGGAAKGALPVKVGDKVLFGRNSGIAVRVDGEDLLILPEHEFFVVLT
jgi:chaperonin GroES